MAPATTAAIVRAIGDQGAGRRAHQLPKTNATRFA
jgi:hypothetical protein